MSVTIEEILKHKENNFLSVKSEYLLMTDHGGPLDIFSPIEYSDQVFSPHFDYAIQTDIH